jgi:hypothetical protein
MTRRAIVTSFADIEPAPLQEVPWPNPADRDAVYLCDAPGCGRPADTLHLIGRRPIPADTTSVVLACSKHGPDGLYYPLADWLLSAGDLRAAIYRKEGGRMVVALADARLTRGVA